MAVFGFWDLLHGVITIRWRKTELNMVSGDASCFRTPSSYRCLPIGSCAVAIASLGTLFLSLPVSSAFVAEPSARFPHPRPVCPSPILDRPHCSVSSQSPLQPHDGEGSSSRDECLLFAKRHRGDNDESPSDWRVLRIASWNIVRSAGRKIKTVVRKTASVPVKVTKLIFRRKKKTKRGVIAPMQQDVRNHVQFGGGLSPMAQEVRNPVQFGGGLSPMAQEVRNPVKFGLSTGAAVPGRMARRRQPAPTLRPHDGTVLGMASALLEADPVVPSLLGVPIRVEQPYSREPGAVKVKGRNVFTMEERCQVNGPLGMGVANISSKGTIVVAMEVKAGGRLCQIDVQKYTRGAHEETPLHQAVPSHQLTPKEDRQSYDGGRAMMPSSSDRVVRSVNGDFIDADIVNDESGYPLLPGDLAP